MPTGVKSNSVKGTSPPCASAPAMSRFGGVPISVVSPPSREPNASGISSRDGGTSVRRAMSTTTGSISAATPMLFMKADSPPETSMITMISVTSFVPASRIT